MKHIIFLIVPLSVGLGVGYWLLIAANTQKDTLKNIGNILGGFLIALTFFASIFGFYFFSTPVVEYPMERMMPLRPYCHHHFYQHPQMFDDEDYDQDYRPERSQEDGKLQVKRHQKIR